MVISIDLEKCYNTLKKNVEKIVLLHTQDQCVQRATEFMNIKYSSYMDVL